MSIYDQKVKLKAVKQILQFKFSLFLLGFTLMDEPFDPLMSKQRFSVFKKKNSLKSDVRKKQEAVTHVTELGGRSLSTVHTPLHGHVPAVCV